VHVSTAELVKRWFYRQLNADPQSTDPGCPSELQLVDGISLH